MNRKKRILIAAVKSGSGKTIFTCGLLNLLKSDPEAGRVSAYKCGPDYIDPMFHRKVLGIPGTNLDPFFSDEEDLRRILSEEEADTVVVEGAMGIYDGISGMGKTGSCYDVAKKTGTKIVLVADASGMGATIVSVLKGILLDDTEKLIAGIVFNRMSDTYLEMLRPMLEEAFFGLGRTVRILGAIPKSKEICFESRHLGLVMPDETKGVLEQIDAYAQLMRKHLDLKALSEIASMSDEIKRGNALPVKNKAVSNALALGVARDEAFCFYYEQNLKAFTDRGVVIREFSPLNDEKLPEGISGLLLGGGYPELFLEQLANNERMKEQIREAISGGMPSLAECGGFMYLGEYIEDEQGVKFPMAGVVPGGSSNKGKLTRFGYVTVSPQTDGLLKGPVRAHEFHYFDSEENGTDCIAKKPGSSRSWNCMHMSDSHLWGYPHLYYPSLDGFVDGFIRQMEGYAASGTGKGDVF